MPSFKRGDVILVSFRFSETNETKTRPAVVIEGYKDYCLVCQITSKNRSNTHRGFWIEKESDTGKQMGLQTDSFINAEVVREVEYIMIFAPPSPIGYCPFIDELERIVEL